MTIDDFPEDAPARPVWLMTLADLALLLVGFFVFLQAAQQLDQKALATGIRKGFGAAPPGIATPPGITTPPAAHEPMAVGAAAMLNFASGSAVLPVSPSGLIAWARDATRDPRVTLRISGSTDGSTADVDAATGNGAVLAADRARAVAASLARARVVAPGRMTIVNSIGGTRRAVTITSGFAGQPTALRPAMLP